MNRKIVYLTSLIKRQTRNVLKHKTSFKNHISISYMKSTRNLDITSLISKVLGFSLVSTLCGLNNNTLNLK